MNDTPLCFTDIADHPLLPAARKVYLDQLIALYDGEGFASRLLIDSARLLLSPTAIALNGCQDARRRDSWLTVGRLKREMMSYGLANDRQIDELVDRLRAVGFLTVGASPYDKRVRILTPSETLLQHDRDWLAVQYAPLALLYPQRDYGLILRRDPAFQVIQRREARKLFRQAAQMLSSLRDMAPFYKSGGNLLVLFALLQAAMAAAELPVAVVPYGVAAERYGIARGQLRELLLAAAAASLIKFADRGVRHIEILPRLWRQFDHALGVVLYLHDRAYGAAQADIRDDRQSTPKYYQKLDIPSFDGTTTI